MKKLICLIVFYSASISAKDLGTFGETFPIVEENLLSFIQGKLSQLHASNELAKHQSAIVERVVKSIRCPAAVEGLIKTKEPRQFYYDPSILVPYDLKDHRGIVFHKAGTFLNPLELYTLRSPLLFIDGEDAEQVDWAKRQNNTSKIILVKGSPFELMKGDPQPIYFDQGGSIVKKLGIQQVPARVEQQGKKLMVSEILLEKTP